MYDKSCNKLEKDQLKKAVHTYNKRHAYPYNKAIKKYKITPNILEQRKKNPYFHVKVKKSGASAPVDQ